MFLVFALIMWYVTITTKENCELHRSPELCSDEETKHKPILGKSVAYQIYNYSYVTDFGGFDSLRTLSFDGCPVDYRGVYRCSFPTRLIVS